MTNTIVTIAIYLFVGSSLLHAKVSKDEIVTAPFVGGTSLKVQAWNAQISVKQKDGENVRVTAKITANTNTRLELPHVEVKYDDDNSLIVSAVWPDRKGDEGVGFEIEVPAVSGIQARTQNDAIEVVGLSGRAELKSTNGPIQIRNHDGPVIAETSNDKIVVAHVTGDLNVNTSNDRITIADNLGNISARTSNGPISVVRSEGQIELNTSNDRIEVRNHLGAVSAQTSNDRIMISDVTGVVKARTTNDDIEISGAHQSVDAETSNSRISVDLSDGAPGPVKARTRNGNVSLSIGSGFVGKLKLDAGEDVIFENVPATMSVDRIEEEGVLDFGDGEISSVKTNESIHFKMN